jgi:mono/diheme cytochrome c family protein
LSARRPWLALCLVAAVVACHGASERTGEPTLPVAGAAKGEEAAVTSLPLPDLGYEAREGRALFQHYCSTCHGAQGHGDGFNSYTLDPKPRDLSDRSFQAAHTDEELASVIRSGGPAAGLSTGMPPWGRVLSTRRIHELVIYVRTFEPEEQ